MVMFEAITLKKDFEGQLFLYADSGHLYVL